MLNLYVEILKLLLIEELYPAGMADLSYSIEAGEKGIVLKFSGFNEKLHVSLTRHNQILVHHYPFPEPCESIPPSLHPLYLKLIFTIYS
jgi:secreted Zn-dependent insulinase-like peptidase